MTGTGRQALPQPVSRHPARLRPSFCGATGQLRPGFCGATGQLRPSRRGATGCVQIRTGHGGIVRAGRRAAVRVGRAMIGTVCHVRVDGASPRTRAVVQAGRSRTAVIVLAVVRTVTVVRQVVHRTGRSRLARVRTVVPMVRVPAVAPRSDVDDTVTVD